MRPKGDTDVSNRAAIARLIGKPVGDAETYHYDNVLDIICKGFVAAFLPVGGRCRLLSQHHSGAMGEEVYWSQLRLSHDEMCCSDTRLGGDAEMGRK